MRIPAAEIEQLVTSGLREWLLDPGDYQATGLPDLSAQRRLVARAAEIGKSWPESYGTLKSVCPLCRSPETATFVIRDREFEIHLPRRSASLSGFRLRPRQDEVIAMLRRPEGATVEEVASATGWQRHTVRGVYSGTLKKKLGLTLASAKEERGRVYRIAEPESA